MPFERQKLDERESANGVDIDWTIETSSVSTTPRVAWSNMARTWYIPWRNKPRFRFPLSKIQNGRRSPEGSFVLDSFSLLKGRQAGDYERMSRGAGSCS